MGELVREGGFAGAGTAGDADEDRFAGESELFGDGHLGHVDSVRQGGDFVGGVVWVEMGGSGRAKRAMPTSENPDMGHPDCAATSEERESARSRSFAFAQDDNQKSKSNDKS